MSPTRTVPPDLPAARREPEHGAALAGAPAQALLAAHVPLSLLLDLAQPGGPRSAELLTGEPGDTAWLR